MTETAFGDITVPAYTVSWVAGVGSVALVALGILLFNANVPDDHLMEWIVEPVVAPIVVAIGGWLATRVGTKQLLVISSACVSSIDVKEDHDKPAIVVNLLSNGSITLSVDWEDFGALRELLRRITGK